MPLCPLVCIYKHRHPPAREQIHCPLLCGELPEYYLCQEDIASNEKIEKHAAWVAEFLPKYEKLDKNNIQEVLRREVGNVFVHVLEDAGVYKCTPEGRDAFMRFINTL